jgi:hypothetical protein
MKSLAFPLALYVRAFDIEKTANHHTRIKKALQITILFQAPCPKPSVGASGNCWFGLNQLGFSHLAPELK